MSEMDLERVSKALDNIEEKISKSASKEEIEKLGEEQKNLARQILELSQKSIDVQGAPEQKSVGELFVSGEAYQAFQKGAQPKAYAHIDAIKKSANDPMLTSNTALHDTLRPYYRSEIIPGAFRPLTIESLFPSVPITDNAFTYVKETKFENGADFVAEGGTYGKSSVTFDSVSDTVKSIGHFARISKQLAADGPALMAYINLRMIYGVDLKVEDQLVKGAKGSNSFDGIFQASNHTEHGVLLADVGGKKETATLFDVLLATITKLEGEQMRPNVILLSPADWSTMRMIKNASGDYYLGSPNGSAPKNLWGVPIVTSPAVEKGKFMVCDTTQAGMIYDRSGVDLNLYEQDADNVQKGLVTIVATRRLGFGIERKNALFGGGLSIPMS